MLRFLLPYLVHRGLSWYVAHFLPDHPLPPFVANIVPYFQRVAGLFPNDLEGAVRSAVGDIQAFIHTVLAHPMTELFACLFTFRYLRLIVHLISFWLVYRPAPIPSAPTLHPSDCTIILPTVDPTNPDFDECITSCLLNKPGAIFIVTVGQKLTRLTKEVVAPLRSHFPETTITVKSTNVANKRVQVAYGLLFVRTKITVLLDDHVFWPSRQFLPTLLAPFEDPKVGIVGTNKRVRRTDTGFNMKSFWNMLGALYLERHNFEIRATNAIDGGVFVVSGRTSAHRSEILQDPKFIDGFTNERFFFGLFGPLNADDDNFITRWDVKHGWKVKIQYCNDALIETTLGTYPKFLSQCLRWVRTTWRSNSASLFTDRTVWYRQPWCVYAVYWTSFVNFALFYDAALVYTLAKSPFGNLQALAYLGAWIFFTKMVKLTPYFLREPQDLIMLPGYFAFAYFHSLIKLYAGLTFWKTNWGGRNLDAINQGQYPNHTNSNNNDNDSNSDASEGGVPLDRVAPVTYEKTQYQTNVPAPPAAAAASPSRGGANRSDADNEEGGVALTANSPSQTKRNRGRPRKVATSGATHSPAPASTSRSSRGATAASKKNR